MQLRIQGAPTLGDPYFIPNFLKNCMKLKKFVSLEGHARSPPFIRHCIMPVLMYDKWSEWKLFLYFKQLLKQIQQKRTVVGYSIDIYRKALVLHTGGIDVTELSNQNLANEE